MHALRLVGGTGLHFQSTLLAGRSARHGFGLAACRPFRISVLRPAPDRRPTPTHQARAPAAACKRDFPYMYCAALPRPRARTDMYFVMSVSLVTN